MKRMTTALTFAFALALLFGAGTAQAETMTPTQQVLKQYRELVDKAPWGVGGGDFDAAKDLLKAAKKAEKKATPLEFAQLQRVQGMTNFLVGMEFARVGSRGWKLKFAQRMTYAAKDAKDLKKAFDENSDLVGPVWTLTKADFDDIMGRYGDMLKKKGRDLKEKLEMLKALMDKAGKDKPKKD